MRSPQPHFCVYRRHRHVMLTLCFPCLYPAAPRNMCLLRALLTGCALLRQQHRRCIILSLGRCWGTVPHEWAWALTAEIPGSSKLETSQWTSERALEVEPFRPCGTAQDRHLIIAARDSMSS